MKLLLFSTVFVLALSGHAFANVERSNDVRSYFKKIDDKKKFVVGDTCDECKIVVADLKAALSDPTKLDRIKFILKLVCDYLGGQEAQQCKNMIDNLDMLIHQLQPFLDNPEQLCKEIHLCAQAKIPTVGRLTLLLMKSVVRNLNSARGNDILCDECMFIATELKQLLSQPSIQQKIKEEIEGICHMFRSLEQECDNLVEQYFNLLMQTLETLLDNPKQVCADVRMCTGFTVAAMKLYKAKTSRVNLQPIHIRQQKTEIQKFFFLYPKIQTENGESAACLICDIGLDKLIDKLNQPAVMRAISSKMSKVLCNALPSEFQTNCMDFTGVYIVSVISRVINKWTPEEICTGIDACTNTSIATIDSMTEEQRSEATCEACRVFTEFLSYELRQQSLQTEIVQILKTEVCRMLPGDLANQCSDAADAYVPSAMQMMSDYVSQPGFCNQIYLC